MPPSGPPRALPSLLLAALLVPVLAGACGRSLVEALDPSDAGPDASADAGVGPDAGPDAGADAGADAGPDAGATPALRPARVIAHLHSPLSHDACDGHSDHAGPLSSRDQACLQQLEDALCQGRIDVAFLTDHPSYVGEQVFEDALLSRAGRGEQLLAGDAGTPVANLLPCPDGRRVAVATGVEATHTMPLGLERKLPRYSVSTVDATPLADLQQAADEIHAAGGLYFIAHSEEPDLSAATLRQVRTDGMEWYNPHGNFKHLYGGDGDSVGAGYDLSKLGALIDTLKGLEPFLAGGSAQADLVFLELLAGGFPEAGVQKVHDVLGGRRVTAVLGSDVHQNVSIQPLCKGAAAQAACQAAAGAWPNLLTALAAGGQITLSDGARLDSFARILRWQNNRVLVPEPTLAAVKEGLKAGRVWSVFAALGEPGPFSFWAEQLPGPGVRIELGGEAVAGATTLRVRLPDAPAPELGASWSAAEAATAVVRTVLWRTTATGKEKAAEWTGTGREEAFAAAAAGAYTVEVWITPRHLEAALGAKARGLAAKEFRWVMSNAIYVR